MALLTKAQGDALKAELGVVVDKYVQQAPTITGMTVTPSALPYGGGQVTVNAVVTDADTITLDGALIASLPTTAGVTADHMFHLVAANAADSVSAQAAVSVAALPPMPTIANMTATPSNLPVGGGQVVVDAQVMGADVVTLSIDGGTATPVTLPVTVTLS